MVFIKEKSRESQISQQVTDIYQISSPRSHGLTPLVFENPHSGTRLPKKFKFACQPEALKTLSDLFMDRLLKDVPDTDATVITHRISRAYIDLNRTTESPTLIPTMAGPVTRRLTPIYAQALSGEERSSRIEEIYTPYYGALDRLMTKAQKTCGKALHLSMHSMYRAKESDMTDIVLGDRHGATCPPEILNVVREFFKERGYSVSANTPFSGANLIRHTANPGHKRYSLQIEIARDLYMDQETLSYLPEKALRLQKDLKSLALMLKTEMVQPDPVAPKHTLH